jgi:hypothetical protein
MYVLDISNTNRHSENLCKIYSIDIQYMYDIYTETDSDYM